MGALPVREKSSDTKVWRPAWYKASEAQTASYKVDLQGWLETLQIPEFLDCSDIKCESEMHTVRRDDFVQDLLSAVVESSHAEM